MVAEKALSEDALNRFRITHSDRELRPLLRRLHRFPHLKPASVDAKPNEDDVGADTEDAGSDEIEKEKEMIQLEVMKWKLGVERIMASVRNLERQRETYLRRAEETVAKTESLKITLEEQKILLEQKRRERDRMIKCDEVAARVLARGKTRKELDEQIANLRQSVEDHKQTHKAYLDTAQSRVDVFDKISELVKECRELKLPVDPNATISSEDTDGKGEADTKMDVDDASGGPSSSTGGSSAKLSSMALPFQPSSSAPKSQSRSSTPPPAPAGSGSTSGPASSSLPARPRPPSGPSSSTTASSVSRIPSRPGHSTLPNRPSALRSSTTPAGAGGSGGSLEEGELGGDEDGEVMEGRGMKRVASGAVPAGEARATRRK